MSELDKKSILQMAMGAIEERVDYEMNRVIDNILDVNTKATGKRTVTVVLDLIPDDDRKMIKVSATAKAKIQPTNPIATALAFVADGNGQARLVEMVPQIPGQFDFAGGEQRAPAELRLLKNA